METCKKNEKRLCIALALACAMVVLSSRSHAREAWTRYAGLFARPCELPAALVTKAGGHVDSPQEWTEVRRPEIIELYEEHVYGRSPERPSRLHFTVFDREPGALSGRALRKQVAIELAGPGGPVMDLLLYLPADSAGPAPVFLLLNFMGNHAIHPDPAIKLEEGWVSRGKGVSGHRATESSRGSRSSRFPVEDILARGYGLATAYYGDMDPDFDDGFKNGLHGALGDPATRTPDSWGAISAWAYGLRRAMDYLEKDPEVDAKRVAVLGHSRLAKTALWAGAQDDRFAIVISNESGCGGAALFRRKFGETVRLINANFPHWFCGRFHEYDGRAEKLPVDQHMLIALIAPRPVYVASAESDWWSDPEGEFLAALHAGPVYELFGKPGLPVDEMPPVNAPVSGTVGYHVRSGGHDLTASDWHWFMDFTDTHFSKGSLPGP